MKRRTKKKLLLEAIIVGIILTTLTAFMIPKFLAAQNINTTKHFPDPNFRRVIEQHLGIKPGEPFHATDAAKFDGSIKCDFLNIKNLKGIEYLTNINAIHFTGNKVRSFDFSQNKKLKVIGCTSNLIENLDLSNLTNLKFLHCSANKITELDISNNTKLIGLSCVNNKIEDLDISKNVNLHDLSCSIILVF